MKKIFVVLVIFMICGIAQADVNDVNVLTLEQCRARILELERIVRSQQDRIEKLIARLKNQTGRGQDINTPKVSDAKKPHIIPPFDPNNGIVYNGTKRNLQWFNYFYKENQNKIAFVDGKYIYIADKLENRQGEVQDVLDNGEAIIRETEYVTSQRHNTGVFYGDGADLHDAIQRNIDNAYNNPPKLTKTDRYFHIKGYKKPLIDKQPFNCAIIRNGIFEYTTTTGANKTVESFIVYEPITKEQFADAINSGFILIKQTKNNGKPAETPIRGPRPKQVENNGKITETPIQ